MGLFSSSKTTNLTENKKEDTNLTFGGDGRGNFVAGNRGSNITIHAADADVVKAGLDFAEVGLDTATSAIVGGFNTALSASQSADERLSGKVFTSVNIGLGLGVLAILAYVFKKK